MIKCVEFDRPFASKELRNDALLLNAEKLIQLKCEAVYKSCEKGQTSVTYHKSEALKGAFDMQEGFFYPVINTTNWLDSHNDVHFPSLWDESLVSVKNSLAYVMDHKLDIDKTIAFPGSVEAFVKNLEWTALGQNIIGSTQALIFKIALADIFNSVAEKVIRSKISVQNSVRMGYEDIMLAINDERPEFKENKQYFDQTVDTIANKQYALENGYYWGIRKASISKEGSMVLFGSNKVTPIFLPFADMTTERKTESAEPVKEAVKTIYNYLSN